MAENRQEKSGRIAWFLAIELAAENTRDLEIAQIVDPIL